MNTKLTVLAALLFAGASQAALAQEHDHDRWHDPGQRPAGEQPRVQAQPSAPAQTRFQPQPAPPAAPQAQPGGGRWGGGERHWNGGDRGQFRPQPQVQPTPAPTAPQPGPRTDRGDHRWGDRNGFAPGGTANGDRRWDRHDAPREVVPPRPNAERGWDRDHDGHGPADRNWDRNRRDGDRHWDRDDRRFDGDHRWDRDGRGPPANWQRWDRNRFPPVYSSHRRFRSGAYHRPYGWYVRSWAFGDFLPNGWFAPDYWIDDFWDYDLPYPPPGLHWVRVGDDALLVDDYTGRVFQVVRDIFW